jgi:hypothetical protein
MRKPGKEPVSHEVKNEICRLVCNKKPKNETMRKTDKVCPSKKVLHIVTDNLSAHKTKAVYKYLESRPDRFVLYFIPTHSSWLNLVER